MNKISNPAVVGLGGFGFTTLILQLHNLGLCGLGPILAMGLIFGGLAQFIAGFQEQKTGNNFGYCAFVAYGSFWMGFGIILILNYYKIYESSRTDLAYFLAAYALYTLIMFIASLRIHTAMMITFLTLFLGFALLAIGHFGPECFNKVAAVDLIICALSAWYMMIAIIMNDLAGKVVMTMGKPWIKKQSA